MPDIRRYRPGDRDRALETVVEAFATDPILRWVWPEDERYAGCAPAFFGLLLDLRLEGGEVWVADGGDAVAMWDPPGGLYGPPAEERWAEVRQAFTPAEQERWRLFDQALTIPDGRPRWYLGVLATAPARQGQGLARAALAPILAAADRTGLPACLETGSTANVAYYARLGFAPVAEADLPDGGPRAWVLCREPVSP